MYEFRNKLYTHGSISLGDPKYPQLLKGIPDPPKTIYYKGAWVPTLFNKCLGIVGSRKITEYGEEVIEHLLNGLPVKGFSIISGFMRGVDIKAHRTALQRTTPTIAVLPCGIELIYPSNQHRDYHKIVDEGGLVLSEWGGVEPPKDWTFPRRNRIIAGLCTALIVVEASLGSGSLITANLANKYKKPVYAVPADIFRNQSKGICQLLGTFAKAVYSSSQIAEFLGLDPTEGLWNSKNILSNSLAEKEGQRARAIVSLLSIEPMDITGLSLRLQLSTSDLSAKLTELQLIGAIKEIFGFYHVCKS